VSETKIKPSTRARLIENTVALLDEGGYAAASVSAITERTGVAAGTLYRHFPSKEALFVEVFRDVCGGELAAMRAAAGQNEHFEDELAAVIEVFSRRALKNRQLAWALLAEPVDPLVDAERLEFRRRYRDLIAEILTRGVEQGRAAPLNVELTAAALVGAIGEALVGPLAPSGHDARDADAVVPELIAFCTRSIRPAA
jgi:AcrR family transcriptional regulator